MLTYIKSSHEHGESRGHFRAGIYPDIPIIVHPSNYAIRATESRPRGVKTVLLCALLISMLFVSSLVLAARVDRDLEGIKKKIEKERRGISRVEKQEGSLLQSLEEIEGERERKSNELKDAKNKLRSITGELRQKQTKAGAIESSIEKQRELFKERAVALYRWQRSGSPFVIFSGDVSLGALLQRKRYLETALSFDRDLVTQLSDEARVQEVLQKELARKKDELETQEKRLADAREAIRREEKKKKQILTSIRQEKETRLRALKELEQAALRLQKMLDEISRRAVSKPSSVPSGVGLGALYGKLEWPVKGELVSGFGKTRHREFAAEVFRNGIDIGAPLGEEIKAVDRGIVVFADRFTGYGRMIIVDHGERYYSVYAHLSENLKRSGDTVNRGETLGLVGDSDSLAGAKLYFELRKDGRSVDPLPWFKK